MLSTSDVAFYLKINTEQKLDKKNCLPDYG